MKYDLVMPRPEFDKADRLVRSVLLCSRVRKETPRLRTATSSMKWLTLNAQAELEANQNDLFGMCFQGGSQFDLWIHPAFVDPTKSLYVDTVLHELVHGYLGCYEHNAQWRRFFLRVLQHYHTLVAPLEKIERLQLRVVRDYTRQTNSESDLDFGLRQADEINSVAKTAVSELDSIARTYERLTLKESRAQGRNLVR